MFIGTSEADLRLSLQGTHERMHSVTGFEDTLRLLGLGRIHELSAVARLLILNGSALLSYRPKGPYRRGEPNVTEVQLAGSNDPTALTVEGRKFRLSTCGSDEAGFTCYLKAFEPPTCADAEALLKQFSSLFQQPSLTLGIRQDVWFATPSFPVLFRFEPDDRPITYYSTGSVRPPSVHEYYRVGSEVMIDARDGRRSCTAWRRESLKNWGE